MNTGFTDNQPTELSQEKFLAVFGGVYEHSPWIAEQVFERGLTPVQDTAEGLAAELRDIVEVSGRDPQLVLLRAHPDLAGKLALAGDLTAESTGEQAGAGLDHCTAAEFETFQSLNDRYKEKFGFPFILAVRGYHRTEILEIFKVRVENDLEVEFAEALSQVHRIALLRLEQIS
jgi:OHCU decarboxylase